MSDPAAVAFLLTCSVAAIATGTALRTRLTPWLVDLLLALEGAGVAAGGLLVLDDVGTWSWIVAPTLAAIAAPLHVRVLFAGEGPFRT